MTGYPQQQPTPVFSAFAAVPQQQPPQPTEQNKFQPANIFAKMKQGDIGKSPDTQPQSADKYDALRPQQTGMMMPLSTGEENRLVPRHTLILSYRLQWRNDAATNGNDGSTRNDAAANGLYDEWAAAAAADVHAANWLHAWNAAATAAARLQVLDRRVLLIFNFLSCSVIGLMA